MLITPYKGTLVDLVAPPEMRDPLFSYAAGLRSLQLTQRECCDLELLATGGFSPLDRFMGETDYCSVLDDMRLADGSVFPIPITLSTDDLTDLKIGGDIALRSLKNDLLAVMTIDEIYEWNRERFAEAVLGTSDPRHPLVPEMREWGRFHLSGKLRVLKTPEYHDFRTLRLAPKETRERLHSLGRDNVVAFQTRNPMHRAHEIMTQRAIKMIDGTLLMHPTVGMTRPGDIDYFTRVRSYKAITRVAYERNRVLLSLLPLAMRMAGPREAVWHAIIRRNYGANHLIVGRDHASPGTDANGKPFYDPSAAQKLAREMSAEIGVKIIEFQEFAYLPAERRFEEIDKMPEGRKTFSLSGTRIREDFLGKGIPLPAWFTRPEVAKILAESYPPKHQQGVCLWFTGLSGAGKSTTAEIVATLLLEHGRRSTLLDGDVVRTQMSKGHSTGAQASPPAMRATPERLRNHEDLPHLSRDRQVGGRHAAEAAALQAGTHALQSGRLGFSKVDRDINVNRIGFIAAEIVRHGGVAICAAISPYREARNQVRQMFAKEQFVEIFVDTPLEVCEGRDSKGMYAKARRGEIRHFTGIDDVYEPPETAEISLDTVEKTAHENARFLLGYLRRKGFVTAAPLSAASASSSAISAFKTAYNAEIAGPISRTNRRSSFILLKPVSTALGG